MSRLFLFLMLFVSLAFPQKEKIRSQVEHLIRSHHYTQAEQLLQQHQDKPNALYYLSLIKMIKGNLDEAVELAQKGLKISPQPARFYELLGDIYAVKAQNSGLLSLVFTVHKIKKYWQKAIEADSTRLSAYQKLFSFYLMAPGYAGGDEQQALQIAHKVQNLNPALGQTMLGQYYQHENQNERAAQAFNTALKLAPDSARIIEEAAYFYLRTQKYDKARSLFEKALHLTPKAPTAYAAFADWYYKTGKKDSALTVLQKAIALDSLNQELQFKKARFLADLGRYEAARAICKNLLKQEMFFALRKQVVVFLQMIKNK